MNQNPEQIARDHIDRLLVECGWLVQSKNKLNLAAGLGVAVTEYRTDTGPVDYLLFIDKTPVGVIEAKKAEEGVRLTTVEDQSERYAKGKLIRSGVSGSDGAERGRDSAYYETEKINRTQRAKKNGKSQSPEAETPLRKNLSHH